MKGILKTVIVFAALLAIAVPALAENVRITGNCNVRTGPGLSYETIDVVYAGEVLEYWDETAYDSRGVAWYNVIYGNLSAWVSSKYAVLEADNPTPAHYASQGTLEISGYFMQDLKSTAQALSLNTYMQRDGELPNMYTDGVLTISGYDSAENIEVNGAGYSIFGVETGMDKNTAKQVLQSAGLVYDSSYDDTMFFDHGRSNGYDGYVDVTVSRGKVKSICWCWYND